MWHTSATTRIPGWKAKGNCARRDAPERRRQRDRLTEKAAGARGVVDFLQKVAQPASVLARALDDYQLMAATAGDYYLTARGTGDIQRTPCYFRDFIDRARHTV